MAYSPVFHGVLVIAAAVAFVVCVVQSVRWSVSNRRRKSDAEQVSDRVALFVGLSGFFLLACAGLVVTFVIMNGVN